MIYGYARVSTAGQERDGNGLEAQKDQLTAAGAEVVMDETGSGMQVRPVLTELLERLESGDTLILTKLDRLGRSVLKVTEQIEDLLSRNVTVRVLNMPGVLDNSPTGRLMRSVLLAFAEFERDLIVARTQEGKAIARQRPGYREGRRPKYTKSQLDHAMSLLEDHSYSQVAAMTGISKATLGRERRRRKENMPPKD